MSKVLYIAGHGHSGSTILDLILGSHSRMISVGEIECLAQMVEQKNGCTCGRSIPKCDFWSSVARIIQTDQSMDGMDFEAFWRNFPASQSVSSHLIDNRFHLLEAMLVLGNRRLFRLLSRYSSYFSLYYRSTQNSWKIFDAIHRNHQQAEYIVDSSKTPIRLKLLDFVRKDCVWVIHLVRDGRAVAASYKRRENAPVRMVMRNWVSRYRSIRLVMRNIAPRRCYFLKYEDLCTDPVGSVKSICDWLGLDYEPEMLEVNREEFHNIGGNRMRFNPAERSRIRIDEKWKAEWDRVFSEEERMMFDQIAGRLSRRLGYKDI